MKKELEKAYLPQKTEDAIYELWQKSGYFNPDKLPGKRAKTYSISMPPPNATGQLHIGHAVMLAIQDILIRFHRLNGKKTLWLPGTDHAAIATQNVVEKQLKKEGETKYDLGREEFVRQVEEFIENSRDTIKNQIKKMGTSCDWSRERYTLDPGLTQAVQEVFIKMHRDGLIYRGHRIVNWCPRCESTLADDEVEYKEENGKLYYIRYPLEDKVNFITVATTRPETMLGDTAVAVNPNDARYSQCMGQQIILPLMERMIPLIKDTRVDLEFGTGAVKVTPAHDPLDAEIGQTHNLPVIQVIDQDGTMTNKAKKYAGLKVLDARTRVVEDLTQLNLIEKIEDYTHNISICYRCSTAIEPLISQQWFIKVDKKLKSLNNKSLKEKSVEAVKKGKIRIIPDRFNRSYLNWMENLHDWCISRQLWFGHRIPVWYLKSRKPVQVVFETHATSTDNEKEIASGWKNCSLSELGKQQAKDLGERRGHEHFDAIFCSDLKRAQETVKIAFRPGAKIIMDKRLRELNYGDLNGKSAKKVHQQRLRRIHEKFPNGESYQDSNERMHDFLEEAALAYPGKRILIVAHAATRYALEHFLGGETMEQAVTKTFVWQPGWEYSLIELPKVQIKSPGPGWKQDPDVLDTWFSSSLWTFSTLGWPKKTQDLKRYHPTSVLETAYDILFFWVARMILMTAYALNDIPFKNVYFHGLIRDKQGRKMSKSLGNGIDPLEMIKKFGADAVRLSLVIGTTPGNDTRMYEEKIAGYRNFVNKLWNVSRFILITVKNPKLVNKKPSAKTLADKWILQELNNVTSDTTKDLENYNFSSAGERLYDFTWSRLADWYLEIAKIEKNKDQILSYILKNLLVLWHPFTPFVTEKIWQETFDSKSRLLIVEPWPKSFKKTGQNQIQKEFALLQKLITEIRTMRAEFSIEAAKILPIFCPKSAFITKHAKTVEKLTKSKIAFTKEKIKEKSISIAVSRINLAIPVKGIVNIDRERERIEKEIKETSIYLEKLGKKLGNNSFVKNAPPEIVAKEKSKHKEAEEYLKKIEKHLKVLLCK